MAAMVLKIQLRYIFNMRISLKINIFFSVFHVKILLSNDIMKYAHHRRAQGGGGWKVFKPQDINVGRGGGKSTPNTIIIKEGF